VLLEAMSCGVPCVASNVGGSRSILAEADTGLLFEPGDAGGLAARLEHILAQPDVARRLGERARAVAVERYDLARLVASEIELLRRVARS
jgi:glycosyltransferase involved in cell wall biosynthesis